MWLFDWLLGKKPEVACVAGDVITDRKFFPLCVQRFDVLKGISIGRCVWGDDKWPALVYAHAHDCTNDSHYGWLCARDASFLDEERELLHEIAHLIITPTLNLRTQPVHGYKWRRYLAEIGGSSGPFRRKNGTFSADYSLILTVEDERFFDEDRERREGPLLTGAA